LESQRNPSIEVSVSDGAPLAMQMLLPNSAFTVFAAMDRRTNYGSEGRGFKSSWARQPRPAPRDLKRRGFGPVGAGTAEASAVSQKIGWLASALACRTVGGHGDGTPTYCTASAECFKVDPTAFTVT